ncbi:hypothetical protein J6590_043053 [Homalodisca vitripennis]|nr:hypothetical protein J6590_043053 [Homalodisca vitripennis]
MEMAGVQGVALSWFRSFLTEREQRVRVGHAVSAPLPVTTVVPQGSITSDVVRRILIMNAPDTYPRAPLAWIFLLPSCSETDKLYSQDTNIEQLTRLISAKDVVVGLILAMLLMVPVVPIVDSLDVFLLTNRWSPLILITVTIPMIAYYPTTTHWTPTRLDL